jgi:hypothetical protein
VLYNTRGTPEGAWLDGLHQSLDAAVAAAYGWPTDISKEDALAASAVQSGAPKSKLNGVTFGSREAEMSRIKALAEDCASHSVRQSQVSPTRLGNPIYSGRC